MSIKNIIDKINNPKRDENNKYTNSFSQNDVLKIITLIYRENNYNEFKTKTEIKIILQEWFITNCDHNPLDKNKWRPYKGRPDTEMAQILGNLISNVKPKVKYFLKENIDKVQENQDGLDLKFNGKNYLFRPNIQNFIELNKEMPLTDISKDFENEVINYEFIENEEDEKNTYLVKQWKRDIDLANKCKKNFGNICKIHSKESQSIYSFLTKERVNYLESHHILPISNQDKYKFKLDQLWNIFPLCPRCHRLLHNGLDEEKEKIIVKMLNEYENTYNIDYLSKINEFLKLQNLPLLPDERELIKFLLSIY